jgi:DNA-binding CsgD family transcriptional regulator
MPILCETDFESEIIGQGLVAALKQNLTEKQGKILDFLLKGFTEQEIDEIEGVSRQSIHQQRVRIRQIAMEILSDASLQRVG